MSGLSRNSGFFLALGKSTYCYEVPPDCWFLMILWCVVWCRFEDYEDYQIQLQDSCKNDLILTIFSICFCLLKTNPLSWYRISTGIWVDHSGGNMGQLRRVEPSKFGSPPCKYYYIHLHLMIILRLPCIHSSHDFSSWIREPKLYSHSK